MEGIEYITTDENDREISEEDLDFFAQKLAEIDVKKMEEQRNAGMYGTIKSFRDRIFASKRTAKLRIEEDAIRKSRLSNLIQENRKGHVTIAYKNNQPVAMVRYEIINPSDLSAIKGPLYEIRNGYVCESLRNQGLYTELRSKIIDKLRAKYGNVPIFCGTSNPSIVNICKANGWEEIGFEEYVKIHGYPPDKAIRKFQKKTGYTAYLFDPRQKEII